MFLSAPQTYYLYGLPTTYNSSESNSYLYGEKEFEQRQDLNVYDFLARTYAPDEARFWQPDPEATTYHGISPYIYCGGDPVNNIDPNGEFIANIIAGVISAAIDATMQFVNNLDKGYDWESSIKNIDITSVFASLVVGSTLVPGASIAAKSAACGATLTNRLVDVSYYEVSSVGGWVGKDKPVSEMIVDMTTTVGPQWVSNAEIKSIGKSVEMGLTRSSIATLTKAEVAESKQLASIITSSGVGLTINCLNSATGSIAGTVIKNRKKLMKNERMH